MFDDKAPAEIRSGRPLFKCLACGQVIAGDWAADLREVGLRLKEMKSEGMAVIHACLGPEGNLFGPTELVEANFEPAPGA